MTTTILPPESLALLSRQQREIQRMHARVNVDDAEALVEGAQAEAERVAQKFAGQTGAFATTRRQDTERALAKAVAHLDRCRRELAEWEQAVRDAEA